MVKLVVLGSGGAVRLGEVAVDYSGCCHFDGPLSK